MQKNRILGATIFLTPSRSNFFVFLEIKFDENILYFFSDDVPISHEWSDWLLSLRICELLREYEATVANKLGKKTPSQTQDDQECVLWWSGNCLEKLYFGLSTYLSVCLVYWFHNLTTERLRCIWKCHGIQSPDMEQSRSNQKKSCSNSRRRRWKKRGMRWGSDPFRLWEAFETVEQLNESVWPI